MKKILLGTVIGMVLTTVLLWLFRYRVVAILIYLMLKGSMV